MKWYAGIGSRETPEDILGIMHVLAQNLAHKLWTLRSGCAPGADNAFEQGAWGAQEIDVVPRPELYLPWPGFEGRTREQVTRVEPQAEAFPIAEFFHPAWPAVSYGGRKLHARNVHQILGRDVTEPTLSSFVVCWTPNGKGGGGTGQAIRIARHYGVEVYDLAKPEVLDLILTHPEFGFA